jgi:2-isopropylmalate synthase
MIKIQKISCWSFRNLNLGFVSDFEIPSSFLCPFRTRVHLRRLSHDRDESLIFDTTLRDGEQSPGASMNTAEKVRLAIQLERLGRGCDRSGFSRCIKRGFRGGQGGCSRIRNSQIAALARATKGRHRQGVGIRQAKRPTPGFTPLLPHPTSIFSTSSNDPRSGAEGSRGGGEVCQEPHRQCGVFVRRRLPQRSGFLCQVFGAAIEAGATTVNLPDTVGYAMPDEFGQLVAYVRKHTPGWTG